MPIIFYICYFQGNFRQRSFSFSGRLEFNSGTFKQEESYVMGYYAMLTGKCLPNFHSARRNNPEG
jgi:hypothetical protein